MHARLPYTYCAANHSCGAVRGLFASCKLHEVLHGVVTRAVSARMTQALLDLVEVNLGFCNPRITPWCFEFPVELYPAVLCR
jgi:hypothetical protein